ncbi:hypothetical protein SASPL_134021 [Salvia splendens]|uniref:F-box domain-containing protein n=1 Tax=Salvia splendens TaxID=180675 RepID=A0A8X8ZIX3_SALSN|nr:hypothetical protein SASPL_134021 [Salvia splendens]
MRMRRFPKKNKVSYLQTIPRELTTQILCRVAASSAADISSIKLRYVFDVSQIGLFQQDKPRIKVGQGRESGAC